LGLQRHGAIQLVELGRSLVVLVARRVQLGLGGGALAQQLLHLPHALGHAVLLFARGLQFPGEIDAVQRGRAVSLRFGADRYALQLLQLGAQLAGMGGQRLVGEPDHRLAFTNFVQRLDDTSST